MLARALSVDNEVEVISFTRQYPRWLFPGASDRDPSQQVLRVNARYMIDSLAPWTWWQTATYILKQQPDIVLLQWWSTYWAPTLWTVARQLGRHGLAPLFLVHNVLPHETRAWDVWLTRGVLSQGRAFLVQTERERQRLVALLPAAKVRIFAQPVDTLFSHDRLPKSQARQQLCWPSEQLTLLFFGIVRPYKGLHYLLEALGLLRQRGQSFGLLVAGEFWESQIGYEAHIKRLGLEEQVRLVNKYIPNEELSLYFSAADVFVAPYVEATASLAVKLALAFKLPVITTFLDPTLELTRDQVTVVPPHNSTALADAIAKFRSAEWALPPETVDAPLSGWGSLPAIVEVLMTESRESGPIDTP